MPPTVTLGGSIGARRDLSVRLGNDLTPQILRLTKPNPLNPQGAAVVAQLYAREIDVVPISDPGAQFTITPIAINSAGVPWCRIDLRASAVQKLAAMAGAIQVPGTLGAVRRVYYAWSYQNAAGQRSPLRYGLLYITAGAAGV